MDILAKELGINFNAQPLSIYKVKDNLWITDSYLIKHAPCPFLKDNKCLIHENKPLSCKIFPLDDLTFFPDESKFNLKFVPKCKGFNRDLIPLLKGEHPAEEILKILKNYLEKEIILLSLQRGETIRKLLGIIDSITQKQSINYNNINDKEKENMIILPLFTFCKKEGFLSKSQIKSIIKEHNNLENVKKFSKILDSLK